MADPRGTEAERRRDSERRDVEGGFGASALFATGAVDTELTYEGRADDEPKDRPRGSGVV